MSRRYRVTSETPLHFITTSTVWWTPIFVSKTACDVIVESLSYCREHKGLSVFAYVIMPTHLHAIVSAGSDDDLPSIVRDFKRHTSKRLAETLKATGWELPLRVFEKAAKKDGRGGSHKVWEEGYHPQAVTSETVFLQKAEYIHNNPVRKGLVRKASDWIYSSAGYYEEGSSGVLEPDLLEEWEVTGPA